MKMIKISDMKTIGLLKKTTKFLTADEVAGYKVFGKDDIGEFETYSMKFAPWINGTEQCYALYTNKTHVIQAREVYILTPNYIPYAVRRELHHHYMHDPDAREEFKHQIIDFAAYMTDGLLAGLDIKFSDLDHHELRFYGGDSWNGPLRRDMVFSLYKHSFLDAILCEDDGVLIPMVSEDTVKNITHFCVHTMDCFHFDNWTLQAYNSFGSVTGYGCVSKLASYISKLKQVSDLMAEAGKLVLEGFELSHEA